MKIKNLLFLFAFFILASFLQSCGNNSGESAVKEPTEQEVISSVDSISTEMDKVIKEVETKVEQTEKEVDDLLDGI